MPDLLAESVLTLNHTLRTLLCHQLRDKGLVRSKQWTQTDFSKELWPILNGIADKPSITNPPPFERSRLWSPLLDG